MTDANDFLDKVFNNARTANGFVNAPVAPELLRQIYDVAKMGPTSMNCQPTRYVFLTSPEAKARVISTLNPGNIDKATQAAVIAIVATDTRFYEFLPFTFPHSPNAKSMFEDDARLAEATSARNGTLGSAYFLLAARALGLDCGPMSGFDVEMVNKEFFPDGRWQTNYLICMGCGDPSKLFDRSPRLSFQQAALVL